MIWGGPRRTDRDDEGCASRLKYDISFPKPLSPTNAALYRIGMSSHMIDIKCQLYSSYLQIFAHNRLTGCPIILVQSHCLDLYEQIGQGLWVTLYLTLAFL